MPVTLRRQLVFVNKKVLVSEKLDQDHEVDGLVDGYLAP
jgi:hypothetical protein